MSSSSDSTIGASGSGGAGAAMAPVHNTGAFPQIIAIKVQFELNTPDGLRKVIFGLEKDTPSGQVIWKINFSLFERTSTDEEFVAVVALNVEVDEALHADAETSSKGFTPGQTAHATGPAADRAKAAKLNQIPKSVANKSIQATLKLQ